MTIEQIKTRNLEKEFVYTTSRSSGPGGQNVNKVNTRIELRFNVMASECLLPVEKEIILSNPSQYLLSSGELLFASQKYRSQLKNKSDATERLYIYIAKTLTPPKTRKKTKPKKSAIEKRLKRKKHLAEIKQRRKKPDF